MTHPTPEEILFVLNGGEDVDLTQLEYAVATVAAEQSFDYSRQQMVPVPSWWPFTQGEIVVVNNDGREPFGECRHVRKWGITFEYFKTLAEAKACSAGVVAGGDR